MAIRLSALAAQALVTEFGLQSMLHGGHIRIYSGAQPASADAAPTGQLLAVVTVGANPVPTPADDTGGLTFVPGSRLGELRDTGDWQVRATASGAPGWWRAVAFDHSPDSTDRSSVRMDGAVGESLDLRGLEQLESGQTYPVHAFVARMPID